MEGDYSITANFRAAGGCFIATAAYGTATADEIEILRDFRDGYMLTNRAGEALIDIYYRISPPIADFITEHPNLKSAVRTGLVAVVTMCGIVLDVVPQFAGRELITRSQAPTQRR
jgi:hypothetical protein